MAVHGPRPRLARSWTVSQPAAAAARLLAAVVSLGAPLGAGAQPTEPTASEVCQEPDWVDATPDTRDRVVWGRSKVPTNGRPATAKPVAIVRALSDLLVRHNNSDPKLFSILHAVEGVTVSTTDTASLALAPSQEALVQVLTRHRIVPACEHGLCQGVIWCHVEANEALLEKACTDLVREANLDAMLTTALRALFRELPGSSGYRMAVFQVSDGDVAGAVGDLLARRLEELSATKGVFVAAPRAAALDALARHATAPDTLAVAGDLLQQELARIVDYLLVGTYRKRGQRVILDLQLIDPQGARRAATTTSFFLSALPQDARQTPAEEQKRREQLEAQRAEERRLWEQQSEQRLQASLEQQAQIVRAQVQQQLAEAERRYQAQLADSQQRHQAEVVSVQQQALAAARAQVERERAAFEERTRQDQKRYEALVQQQAEQQRQQLTPAQLQAAVGQAMQAATERVMQKAAEVRATQGRERWVEQQVQQRLRVHEQALLAGTAPDAPLRVDLVVDRGCGGTYAVRSPPATLVARVRCSRDCYLKLIHTAADGQVTEVFPNPGHPDNRLQGGRIYDLGGSEFGFDFEVIEPYGLETLTAVATDKPTADPLQPPGRPGADSVYAGVLTRGIRWRLRPPAGASGAATPGRATAWDGPPAVAKCAFRVAPGGR